MSAPATARPGEFAPLRIGPHRLDVPVVLAPMAGITNAAFRRLCREYGEGLYVSEMITSRALVERKPMTMRLIEHHHTERIRSIQLYGVDPGIVREAVTMLVAEDRADHIDLNFGCPVPKVTRKGGGAALPWKTPLFRQIIEGAVRAAGDVPLTIKMRMGIDAEHLSYLEAGRIAAGAGVSAVTLHGRTAAQFYSGHADWGAIERLKLAVTDIPVLGNGDIWSGEDAVRMMRETGCDGVVVGRGCLGRPWLFADLQAAFRGRTDRVQPDLGGVADAIRKHARLLGAFFASGGRTGDEDSTAAGSDREPGTGEQKACRDIRKHIAWYLKGYPVGGELRRELALVESFAQLDEVLSRLDRDLPHPGEDAEGPRGRAGSPRRPALPDGWLRSRTLNERERVGLAAAELSHSGG